MIVVLVADFDKGDLIDFAIFVERNDGVDSKVNVVEDFIMVFDLEVDHQMGYISMVFFKED